MKGHILFVADGRSPTAMSWMENVQSLGYQVSLLSSFYCEKPRDFTHFHILPIAFSRFSSESGFAKGGPSNQGLKGLVKRFAPLLQNFRYSLGPLSLLRFLPMYQKLVKKIAPDLVHALRIPYEGMLGSYTPEDIPFLVAIWGNDLTLHARGSWLMRHFTRHCLMRADGLSADTHRDIQLAKKWGLNPASPVLSVPGSGGLNLEAINSSQEFDNIFGIPGETTWVVNPRGLRPGSIHQDVFFEAIPKILNERPDISFVCPDLKGQPQAENWIVKFGIYNQVFLLPKLSQSQLWGLFKRSAIFVSPSSHDGTPNSFIEAMACGCFPIVGDIESMREWITHRKNGYLVDPHNIQDLSQAILNALNQDDLRHKAAKINLSHINNRAAKRVTLPKIESFYKQFVK